MEFKPNDELINPAGQAEVDRDAIMREMRTSLLLLAPEDRDAALRELYQEIEDEAEIEEPSQQMSQLAMGNETPAKKTQKRSYESDSEEAETPQKRPRPSAPKKLFSSQNTELMDKAKFDTTITVEMEQDSVRLMSFLVETQEKEKGDVYLVCDINRIFGNADLHIQSPKKLLHILKLFVVKVQFSKLIELVGFTTSCICFTNVHMEKLKLKSLMNLDFKK
uniref:Uncharacterized protein n=1 Tax=Panagrolaimus sp. ES5 TaxID=591445 RepID=A0AC34FJM1_9BILA